MLSTTLLIMVSLSVCDTLTVRSKVSTQRFSGNVGSSVEDDSN